MDIPAQPVEPVYRIQTRRLIIRCWDPIDALLRKQAVDESREHLKPWMSMGRGEPQPLQTYIDRLRQFRGKFDLGQDFAYAIFNLDETRVLGGAGLNPGLEEGMREIGYWIHPDFINQGLATEAAAALVKIAFEIFKLRRIDIRCDPKNIRSAAIPRKLGFNMEAVLRKRVKLADDDWQDVMVWSIFADEYPASPAAQAEIEAFDVIGRRFKFSDRRL